MSGMVTATLHRRTLHLLRPSHARRHEFRASGSCPDDLQAPTRTRFITSEHWFTTGTERACSIARGGPPLPPAGFLCCSIAATSIPVAGRTSWRRLRRRGSPSSPGTPAAMAAPRGRATMRRTSAGTPGMRSSSSGICRRPRGCRWIRLAVIGHSVGAAIVAAWIHDYRAARARGRAGDAGVSDPSVPAAGNPSSSTGAEAAHHAVCSELREGSVLTHDPAQRARHEQDEPDQHAISTRVLIDLHDTASRLIQDAAAIRVPTLVLTAGSDWVVKRSAQRSSSSGSVRRSSISRAARLLPRRLSRGGRCSTAAGDARVHRSGVRCVSQSWRRSSMRTRGLHVRRVPRAVAAAEAAVAQVDRLQDIRPLPADARAG